MNMRFVMPLFMAVALAGCSKSAQDSAEATSEPRTSVTLTQVLYGNIANDITVSATTAYLKKSVVSAPIAGFLVRGSIEPGIRVGGGQALFTIETKEHRALQGADDILPAGYTAVRTGVGGVVTEVMQQPGSYVTEGAPLCTIAETGSLVFELNVPPEQMRYFKPGQKCTIQLPDGTCLSAAIGTPLATMNAESQVQQLVAYARTKFLPEGMNVRVTVNVSRQSEKQMLLPKAAVQSDDYLQHFWVMKLANDSTAVKVPVRVGNSNAEYIEVHSQALSPADRIILTGGYALEDNARVTIAK